MLGVDDRGVPLDERAAAGVLAGQPDGDALVQQRAERDDLAEAPVDAALDGHLGAPVEQLLDPLVRGEAGRQVDVRLADALDQRGRDRGVDLRLRLGSRGRGSARTVVDASRVALKTVSSCCWKSRSDSSAILDGDVAAADQLLGVELADRALRGR